MARNFAKFRGIPEFQKIPYYAGSKKTTSVDILLPRHHGSDWLLSLPAISLLLTNTVFADAGLPNAYP